MPRRVVITGLGAVTGLGIGMDALWDGLCHAKSALRPIRSFDPAGFRSRFAAEVGGDHPDGPASFSAKDHVPKSYRKAVKVMARDIELAVAAAKLAVEDARLATRGTLPEGAPGATYAGPRMGCHIGAGLIPAEADELTVALATARAASNPARLDLAAWGTRGMDALTPLWLLKYLPNMLACHVTIIHGCEGPSNTITCAEASGLLSIGESVRVIERNAADLCFSGGAEAKVNLMGLLRMDFAGRLAPTADHPDGAALVRPFDPNSPGSLLGEAGGLVILEARDTAIARNARIYAEVVGHGAGHSPPRPITAGAFPNALNAPDRGVLFAIQNALDDADLAPDDIDAILPFASGSPDTDGPEAAALRQVFGQRLASIPLITCTPNIGNLCAGAGGVQAAIAAKAVHTQTLPARIHAGTPAPGLLAGRADAAPAKLNHVLVYTGSLGGQNAALILKRAS